MWLRLWWGLHKKGRKNLNFITLFLFGYFTICLYFLYKNNKKKNLLALLLSRKYGMPKKVGRISGQKESHLKWINLVLWKAHIVLVFLLPRRSCEGFLWPWTGIVVIGIVGKSKGSGLRSTWFESKLCHFPSCGAISNFLKLCEPQFSLSAKWDDNSTSLKGLLWGSSVVL